MTETADKQPPLVCDPKTESHTLRGHFVYYRPAYVGTRQSADLLEELKTKTNWRQESITLYGRQHLQPRLTGWYGLAMSAASRYRKPMAADSWLTSIASLRDRLAADCGVPFNSALANLYRDGRDGMGFHADDEPCLGAAPWIASISLGQTRRFQIRTREPIREGGQSWFFDLQAGDLLVMSPGIQKHFVHGIPKTTRPCSIRINLTFRCLQQSS